MPDVDDAVELAFATATGATVVVDWIDPDGTTVLDDVAVPESPPGSGRYPHTFVGTAPGVWSAVFHASGTATQVERYHMAFTVVTGPPPLATVGEVAEVFRPLTLAEQSLARALLRRASALIRGRFPNLDQRIASGTIPAETAGQAAINMVLPVLRNPNGLRAESVGPFSRTFDVSRAAGLLVLTAAEEKLLEPAVTAAAPAGTIMARPGLAPWPIGVRTRRELRHWW